MYSVLAVHHQNFPPTVTCSSGHRRRLRFGLLRQRSPRRQIGMVSSNSFGFGGTNGTLVFKRYIGLLAVILPALSNRPSEKRFLRFSDGLLSFRPW